MGGRGSSYIRQQTSEEGLNQRARDIHKTLKEMGMPAKKSISETVDILRQSDIRNGLTRPGNRNNTNKSIKWVDTGFGSKYAEKGDRVVQILDGGKSSYNLYKYGSRQVYEVNRTNGDMKREKMIFSRKKDAEKAAKDFLNGK